MTIYDHKISLIDGSELDLQELSGKPMLMVNIASRCGFTPQLASLEELYRTYKEVGLVVIGFPSNDFLSQEPLSNEEIDQFCTDRYNITFPIAVKGPVCGPNKQPVFQTLTEECEAGYRGDPGWNFVKFLVGPDGKLAARYSSITRPLSKKVKNKIESLLS